MDRESTASAQSLELQQHFGANAAEAQQVLDILASEPTRVWRAEDIITASGISPMNVLLVLARGAVRELIEHPSVGAYRAKPSRSVAVRRTA